VQEGVTCKSVIPSRPKQLLASAEDAALNFAMFNIPLHIEILFPDDCRLKAGFSQSISPLPHAS